MDLKSEKKSCTPSPLGASYLKHDGTCQDMMNEGDTKTIRVSIDSIEVNAEDWAKFQALVMINTEGKQRFLSDVVKDMIHHMLYDNPELFNSYVSQPA